MEPKVNKIFRESGAFPAALAGKRMAAVLGNEWQTAAVG